MCCPFFEPLQPLPGSARDAMLPLGDSWNGVCHAHPGPPSQPEGPAARSLCNLGYARGECPRFPEGDAPDAVRFTLAGDSGDGLRLYYVVERDHHPFAHGPLEFATVSTESMDAPAAGLLSKQAGAYVSSYLRRRSEPSRRFTASNLSE